MKPKEISVLYEPEMLIRQRFGGISRYYCELLRHFHSDNQIHVLMPLRYTNNHYYKKLPFTQNKRLIEPISIKGKGKLIRKLLKYMKKYAQWQNERNDRQFQLMAESNEYDICHFTYYKTKALHYVSKRPIVITVYDMIHELYPEYFGNDKTHQYKKLMVESASQIIAISNNTKKDLVRFYNVPESRIAVIYLGCSFDHIKVKPTAKSPLSYQKYILYVGDRKGYKNFNMLLKSLAPLLNQKADLKVICVGGGNFSQSEINLIESLRLVNQITQIQVDDYQLAELYREAQLFIFPSLYEGFGLPLLEAFHCGCPVACSNSSAFPEIAEDAAIFFDPTSQDSIYNAVNELISSASLRSELSKRGHERMKAFSWGKAAQQTKSAYFELK